jgi:hypothetical protein
MRSICALTPSGSDADERALPAPVIIIWPRARRVREITPFLDLGVQVAAPSAPSELDPNSSTEACGAAPFLECFQPWARSIGISGEDCADGPSYVDCCGACYRRECWDY